MLLACRHGYPSTFFERRYILQVLYGKIQNKNKVLVNKRVQSVDISSSDFVSVVTADGCSYTGHIVVGADGVHSTIRREMARLDTSGKDFLEENGEICILKKKKKKKETEREREKERKLIIDQVITAVVPATYASIFGISHDIPGFDKQTIHYGIDKNFTSFISGTLPDDKIFFALNDHMGKQFYRPNIPRFTEKDLNEAVNRHLDKVVNPNVKFRDIYARKIRAFMTPLEEHEFKHWHSGRMITIGDSGYKVLNIIILS